MIILVKALFYLSMLSLALGNFIDFKERRNFSDVYYTCRKVQKEEKIFTDTCYLVYGTLDKRIIKVKEYVNKTSPDLSIADLLTEAFTGSTQYFQDKYPHFSQQYKDFENRIIAIVNKLKTSTSNAKMIEFKNAFFDSKFNVVYENVTTATNISCAQDSEVCKRTDYMLDIDLESLPQQTVNEFLINSARNMIREFIMNFNPIQLEESQLAVDELLESLRVEGTANTRTALFQNLLQTKLYDNFQNYYSQAYEEPTSKKTRTTTFKSTKTKGPAATKVIPQQYVTIDVYLSVPLVILFVGIVFTGLVVIFYYRFKPHVGGSAKMAPTTSAQVQYKTSKI